MQCGIDASEECQDAAVEDIAGASHAGRVHPAGSSGLVECLEVILDALELVVDHARWLDGLDEGGGGSATVAVPNRRAQ